MITQFNYICLSCGKAFKSRGKNRKYCSTRCKYDTMIGMPRHPNWGKKKTKEPTQFICEFCNKPFERMVTPKSNRKFIFCSPSCRNKARTKPDKICPICNKPFKRIGIKKYCGGECANIAQSEKPIIKTTPGEIKADVIKYYPKFGSKPIVDKYGISHATVQRIAYRAKVKLDNDIFRDKVHGAAKQNMIDNNPMKQDSVKRKVAQYWINHPEEKQIALEKLTIGKQRIQRDKPTKLEQKLFQYLTELNISFEPYFLIKSKFIVDALIGNALIIQADGDYWHGHPRFKDLTERQLKQQARDKAQDKYLTTCGYKVVRIWESDMSKELVIKVLKDNDILR